VKPTDTTEYRDREARAQAIFEHLWCTNADLVEINEMLAPLGYSAHPRRISAEEYAKRFGVSLSTVET